MYMDRSLVGLNWEDQARKELCVHSESCKRWDEKSHKQNKKRQTRLRLRRQSTKYEVRFVVNE